MNQGTQGYSLMKKTEGRKSRDTVPLSKNTTLILYSIRIFNFSNWEKMKHELFLYTVQHLQVPVRY
jgi:hypothetical protein